MLASMQRITVKLPDELDARLRHEARRRGRTVSDLTREAIEQLLGERGDRRRLLAAGAGASGRGDISARIEDILAMEVLSSPAWTVFGQEPVIERAARRPLRRAPSM
jgi:predicted DNA-binding protein